MNFYYLHQIKHETCMHEEGMNIKKKTFKRRKEKMQANL